MIFNGETLRNAVNDRKYVFHFRLKPNIWPEKHLALGRIPEDFGPIVNMYVFNAMGIRITLSKICS